MSPALDEGVLQDSYGRAIRDLRISVTDRCNYKCFYCKTGLGLKAVPRDRLLTYEEIERLARIFLELGVVKLRVTGGEPLVRKSLETLIEKLAALSGVQDLALTTNGFSLGKKAKLLKESGLRRVTVSIDSLRRERFREMTGQDDLEDVLEGIRAAQEVGLEPVKVNCVVVRGWNDDEVPQFAAFARERSLHVRFIEFMPLDEDEKWTRDQVVTGDEVIERIRERFALVPRPAERTSDTSVNYGFPDAPGSVGVITTVSRPFCGECSRIRLTADGKLRTCLFSLEERDVRLLLRSGATDEQVRQYIIRTVRNKEAGHRINEPDFTPPPRSMSYIGG
ncbi:MAG: GTP 3',8-cyclase MoaA [Acidobacteriota bacterium]